MGRYLVVLAVAAAVFAPSQSFGAPVTLYYSGSWGFFDPPADAPLFHSTLAGYGVSSSSPLQFSITLDTAVLDSDPNAGSGFFQSAIVGAHLQVGSLFLRCNSAGSCGNAVPNFVSPVGAAQIAPNAFQMVGSLTTLPPLAGGMFAPSFLDFRAQSLASFLTPDSLAAAVSNATGWPTPQLMIGFQGMGSSGGLNLAGSTLTLISVPEVSAIAPLLTGAVLFLMYRRRTR